MRPSAAEARRASRWSTSSWARRPDEEVDVEALHEALERLAGIDPERARLVELRYFGGLTIEETAEALGQSPATVKRGWALARAWLARELQTGGAGDDA